jgi:purine-binding chemotaxis protein CheW
VSDTKQFCTFHLADLYLGVEVGLVQEVIRAQPMTHVPLAPAVVTGLINLRGQLVTALDLRRRFGLPDRPADASPINVVIRTDDGPMSLLADEIADVIELSADAFEPLPDTIPQGVREITTGVYKLPRRLLLSLNTDKVTRL